MSLFGSDSKSSTSNKSIQQGVDGSGLIVSGEKASVVYQFPDAVAALAGDLISLVKGSQDQLGEIAGREKTPLTEWLPIIAVGALALVAIAIFLGRP